MFGIMGIGAGFMQAAGAHGEKIGKMELYSLMVDPEISSITGTDIVVKTTKGGVAHEDTYASLEGDTLSISADKNTKIFITGTITECEIGENADFVRISVKNTALTSLDCNDCYALQELNLSANTALTSLGCNDCVKIEIIYYTAIDSDVATAIAGAITAADASDGTVYTDSAADYYSTIADAATAKGWTIEQIQE